MPGALIARGTPAYRRINIALFLAGFSTFSLIYCVQPLLPLFAASFGVAPATSSLALSLTTGVLALAIVAAGALSDLASRKRLMFSSMMLASLLNLAAALAPDWHLLLIARALEGLVLGGVPAVAMAYLAEEIEPSSLGFAMGLYVGGSAFGGMLGRLGAAVVAEAAGWRFGIGTIAVIGLLSALGFQALLPPSRHFQPAGTISPRHHLGAWGRHLRDARLNLLFLIAFLAMGSFVTVYNYAGFRLSLPPYDLSQSAIGLLFIIYVAGTASASTAGALADRLGRGPVLLASLLLCLGGLALTLFAPLALIIAGVGILTIGFFASHAIASGWVGRLAAGAKGHATSLYLLAYYLGSSVAGSTGGWFWSHGGWLPVAGFIAALLVLALIAALGVSRLNRGAAAPRPAGHPANARAG